MTAGASDHVVTSLRALHAGLTRARLPLEVPGAVEARERARAAAVQLADYVIPRAEQFEAPLLAVVGGSTGAGKSTLVNSLVGQEVSRASAIRPTTRRPVLVHHPDDAGWFLDERVLPSLARVHGTAEQTDPAGHVTELELVAADRVPRGLALLDAPDIDSVVVANRQLAGQLLAAADLWIFLTTAARYADAVPWALLRGAAARRAVVAVVLDRVPPGTAPEVRADLSERLHAEGLAHAPLFVISEQQRPADGAAIVLPDADLAPVLAWLHGLADDAVTRAAVARQTLTGAIEEVLAGAQDVAGAAREQDEAMARLRAAVTESHAAAVEAVMAATEDGTLLRGEVLARWQEFVGTGEWLRGVEAAVGRLRDRIGGVLRGRPSTQVRAAEAIESGLVTLVVAQLERAMQETRDRWQSLPGGPGALSALPHRNAAGDRPELARRVEGEVRAWQRALLERVRSEGEDRRTRARMLSLGVNASGVTLMLVVFALSGGLTGLEVGVAGGTAVVGQKVLEMVFGDQAVRDLARHAQRDLQSRVDRLLEEHREPWLARLAELDAERVAAEEIDRAATAVRSAVAEAQR